MSTIVTITTNPPAEVTVNGGAVAEVTVAGLVPGPGGGGAWGDITGTLTAQTDLNSALTGKQATLVSGTNIKTINGSSLLGSGNITISGGGSGSPGGDPMEIQINDDGAFGGDSTFFFDPVLKTVAVDNIQLSKGLTTEDNINVLYIPTLQGGAGFIGTLPYSNFYFTLAQAYINPDDGQRDAVLMWGWNQNGGGGRWNPFEAEFHTALESDYRRTLGAEPEFEYHWETTTRNGLIQQRIYTMNIGKETGLALSSWQMDSMQWFPSGIPKSEATTPYMIFNKSGALVLQGTAAGVTMFGNGANFVITPIMDGTGDVHINNYSEAATRSTTFNNAPVVMHSPIVFSGNLSAFTLNSTAAGEIHRILTISNTGLDRFIFYANGNLAVKGYASVDTGFGLNNLASPGAPDRAIGIDEYGVVKVIAAPPGSWNVSGSDYYYNGGRVSIGTSTFTAFRVFTINAAALPIFSFKQADVEYALFGLSNGDDGLSYGTVLNDFVVRTANQKIIFSADGGSTPHFITYANGDVSFSKLIGSGVRMVVAGADGKIDTQAIGGFADEAVQDSVAGILSTEFTYDDATPLISINTIAQGKVTGLAATLADKADLVAGLVPIAQLPAGLVAIEEYANFAALPGTGDADTIYITTSDGKRWLWTGSSYAEIAATPPVISVNTLTGNVVLDYTHVGAVPVARTITINGTTLSLAADRSWSVGTVTSLTVASSNGFTGSFTGAPTPVLTLTTSISGLLKGNATAISSATVGTDYSVGTSALATGIIKSTTTTGALSIAVAGDFPVLNQNTTGTANNITAVLLAASFPVLTGDVTTPGGSLATTIANNVVTIAKMQQVVTQSILGRNSASTGNVEVLTTLPSGVMPAHTGDATNTAGSLALVLATVNATTGSFGTATQVGSFTVNGKGLITGAINVTIQIAESQVTGLTTALGLKAPLASPTFTGTVTVPDGSFTLAKHANIATARIIGRVTAASGVQEELTGTQATTLLDVFTSALKGVAPASGGGTTNYLRADGTWTAPTAVVGDGDKGEITITGGVWTVDATATQVANKAPLASPTFTGTVNLPASTTSAGTAPFKAATGVLMTTPEAGAFEYDGKIPYYTPQASKRAVIQVMHFAAIQADLTLTNGNALQSAFPAANDLITLEATTTYRFRGVYIMTTGTTTHTTGMAFALAGGATITSVEYTSIFSSAAANAVSTALSRKRNSGIGTNIVAGTSAQAETVIEFEGVWRHNAAGTVNAQIIFSAAPGGTNLMKVGSFIEFIPIGSNTVAAVGQWS